MIGFYGGTAMHRLAQSSDILSQLVGLQNEIGPLIDGLSGKTIDPLKIAAVKAQLAQCQALGQTQAAVLCMQGVKASLVALSASADQGGAGFPVVGAAATVGAAILAVLFFRR